ncbi:uncharacterized protein N7459_000299 [Penicillium hispanicum]|uniref:uncharacterized protein n=1 Tax=Penicillium hispanicum TaxID=1080232 RepID=UPI002541A2F6|nr:uncharacterized protein N7459_000299 [Penicillium hispanicum]KAJ5594091.1 hypothetical protein N7459_000299 [Penicillium hispanicum]
MLSPTHPYARHRTAPPVRPSRSLEGLERVIPPKMLSSTRSELFLNKPLPAKPLPDAPTEYSVMWSDSSDDSDGTSTVDSVDTVGSPSEPRNSTESYPIFVSSGSDDFSDLVDHPAPADHDHLSLGPIHPSPPRFLSNDSRTDSLDSDLATSRSDAQYGRPSHWLPHRTGANHYFREKKWDFFPELATPSALQATAPVSPGLKPGKTRKKDGRLNRSAKRHRWHSLDRAGLGLAHGVRDSIKTYVHRTLSRGSTDQKTKDSPRPATAPVDPPHTPRSFQHSVNISKSKLPHSSVDVNVQMRAFSVSTVSSASEAGLSPRTPTSPRQKQLAVPLSPYQKYGSAIWETPKKSKKRKHQKSPAAEPTVELCSVNPTPSLAPPFKMQLQQNTRDAVRALQGGKSQVLVALDGAKKKMIESKGDRRREQLKSQIKLVGPVNPRSYTQGDPWV